MSSMYCLSKNIQQNRAGVNTYGDAGEKEMLRDHPQQFAERARSVGVEVIDRVWPGMPHVFQAFGFLDGHMREFALET